MANNKATIALIYDFDKTLCTKDMQEYSFIPDLGIKPKDFWAEAKKLANEKGMDTILAYMYLMIKKSSGQSKPIRRSDFVKLGENIKLFPGVTEWFKRIKEYGHDKGANIEHYIISSGLKEIIEGSSIHKSLKEIFACEFHYNENGVADWPLWAVNYTAKTQFLFRINKGVLNRAEHDEVNNYVAENDRPVPFRNMIYIGDGLTDVPCMKLVKVNGGQSIAVYGKGKEKRATAIKLLNDERVNFIAPAEYSANKELDIIVKQIIDKIIPMHTLASKEFGLRKKHKDSKF